MINIILISTLTQLAVLTYIPNQFMYVLTSHKAIYSLKFVEMFQIGEVLNQDARSLILAIGNPM